MKFTNLFGCSAAALAIAVAATPPAYAQEITSSIRGSVVSDAGAPVANAPVTVTNTRTGATRRTTTSSSGQFSVRNLPVGGPYTVTVQSGAFAGQTLEDVYTDLGETTDLSFQLSPATDTADTIVVSATKSTVAQVAIGPSATFGLDDLQTLPAVNRNINDVLRTDPRIYIDEAFVDAVNCGGANPRFNSLTVDGVRMNDSFGLNSNGYPTERIPFSFDAIEQVAVELSPFDVEYGGFTACNINAVTKSGTNELHGGAFFDVTSDSLSGGSLEGEDVQLGDFTEWRYGATLGGPIIKDKLFFFASYEKLKGANTFDRGPEGSGAIAEVLGFTQADFEEIGRIARDVYGYEPGGIPESFDNSDEKMLVKLDWNINDQHRASFTFNHNDGFNITESDGDADEFEYSNHLYERGAKLRSYVGSMYSDWTENFSTELRVGYLNLKNRQISVAGTDFGEFQIGVDDGLNSAVIYIGADDSRHRNRLAYELFSTAFKADYQAGDHLLTLGFEREQLDVFNIFVQHFEGEYRFGSIADFEAGEPFRIEYANSPTGNPDDAAAEFGYALNTVYAQDEFFIPSLNLTLTGGLRYDWYTSDDVPGENADFLGEYGFTNARNLDGKGLLQPRFGFNWEATDDLTFRGGAGLYTGGNPNVWLSNTYSGSNTAQFTVRDSDVGIDGENLFDLTYVDAEDGTPGGPGYGIPAEMAAAIAGGGRNFEINVLDPEFDLPAEWKFSLGATYVADFGGFLGNDYVFNADLLMSRGQNSAAIKHLELVDDGTAVGGLLPQFDAPTGAAFVLTNADEDSRNFTASFSVAKSHDFGLDWSFGYAYSNAEDDHPMNSAVAFTNYQSRAFVNPNGDGRSESNYNIDHRFVMTLQYEKDFFPNYFSKISLVGSVNSGRPYSYTFINNNALFGFTPFLDEDNVLLYVPTGIDDPNVVFDPAFDTVGFFNYLEENELSQYAGGFAPRNAFNSGWWTKLDLKFEQELPAPFVPGKLAGFIIIDNLTNLINDNWGILRESDFPRLNGVVEADLSADEMQFIYQDFRPINAESRAGRPSLWSIRLGVKYDF